MRLTVGDAALAAIAAATAVEVSGVARVHEVPRWSPARLGSDRGIEVERVADDVVLTVQLVVRRGPSVIEVVRTVQRSAREALRALAGVEAQVVVVVVDVE